MSQTCASFRVRVQSLRAKKILRKENWGSCIHWGGRGEELEARKRADPG